MVSFQCDGCADTVKKPQLDKHRQRCWASFTCLDCSTTFQNQEYKTHTSCISEAEKYQGALYKGPRKGQNQATPATSASATPADSPAPSEGAGTSGIHPSRLNQLQQGSDPRDSSMRGRGGFGQRGGRGAFGGRGGFGGFNTRISATGQNKTTPDGGMRAWGSAPTSDTESIPVEKQPLRTDRVTPTVSTGDASDSKKKKKRKGDKGGTGAKANSRVKSEEATAAADDVPPAKKRKRDDEGHSSTTAETTTSDKTLKRLRKHMSKLEDKVDQTLSLGEWMKMVGQGKEKTIDQTDIMQGVRVKFESGIWQLSL